MTATCACGQASITVKTSPKMLGVCYCTNCKRRAGSAFGISASSTERQSFARTESPPSTPFTIVGKITTNNVTSARSVERTLYWYHQLPADKIGIAGGCFAEQGLEPPTPSSSRAGSASLG